MTPAPAYPPQLFRTRDAAHYVGMSPREFDRAIAAGEMPDPVPTIAGERWRRGDLDLAVDKLAGNVAAQDWRAKVGSAR
jgi:predicted DNA-binding transcriptional regulator AlpA